MARIIATFKAHATDNTPEVEICVRENPASGLFVVFVDGGYLPSNGDSEAYARNLKYALAGAAEELRIVLQGE